jgi:hypothetical protein
LCVCVCLCVCVFVCSCVRVFVFVCERVKRESECGQQVFKSERKRSECGQRVSSFAVIVRVSERGGGQQWLGCKGRGAGERERREEKCVAS